MIYLNASTFKYRLLHLRSIIRSDVREVAADYLLFRLDDDEGHIGIADAYGPLPERLSRTLKERQQ